MNRQFVWRVAALAVALAMTAQVSAAPILAEGTDTAVAFWEQGTEWEPGSGEVLAVEPANRPDDRTGPEQPGEEAGSPETPGSLGEDGSAPEAGETVQESSAGSEPTAAGTEPAAAPAADGREENGESGEKTPDEGMTTISLDEQEGDEAPDGTPGELQPMAAPSQPVVGEGEILRLVDFSGAEGSPDTALKVFGKGDNIEGPVGPNSYSYHDPDSSDYQKADSKWSTNGNLSIVDLQSPEFSDNAAAQNAASILNDTDVFKFYLHDSYDYDRNTSIDDRQRIEIKTDNSDPDVNSVFGEVLTNHWKLFLPESNTYPEDKGDATVTGFYHIFQTKATQGDESSMPVFTFSVTDRALYVHTSNSGHVNQDFRTVAWAPLDEVKGKWLEAELTTYTAEKGYVYVSLKDLSDPEHPVELLRDADGNRSANGVGYATDNWRRTERENPDTGLFEEYDTVALANQNNRSKWGIYRNNSSPAPLAEATMYLGDLYIIKRNADTYVFPDGFDPRAQSKDIYWAVAPDPVEVLAGTDFHEIYLPEEVEVIVEGQLKEAAKVQWSELGYQADVPGTYTVYGTLTPPEGVGNPGGVQASVQITVSEALSVPRANWALGTAQGGLATVKAISESGTNPTEYLIDGDLTTGWKTHSSLVQQNVEGNAGLVYWAAVDLGAERPIDEIYLALGTIGSSKQFRLHNYCVYTTNSAAAYEEIEDGKTGNLLTNTTVTKDPLATANGSAWTAVPGVFQENDIPNGIKAITNNIRHDYRLDTPVTARYVLLRGEVENVEATSGAIEARELMILGDVTDELPAIVSVEALQISKTTGTAFDELPLPGTVKVTLSDGSTADARVVWSSKGYDAEKEGVVTLHGTLQYAAYAMANPQRLTASALVMLAKPQGETTPVNWAREEGVSVKAVSETSANPAEKFVDGLADATNSWKTNSALTGDPAKNDGWKYWFAIDLGAEREIGTLIAQFDSPKNNLARFDNVTFYYTNRADAYDELQEGKVSNSVFTQGTPDPLLTANGAGWEQLGESKASSANLELALDKPVSARYVLLWADVPEGASKGAITGYEIQILSPAAAAKQAIAAVASPAAITVNKGTPFGAISSLPAAVTCTLTDGTQAELPVVWDSAAYSEAVANGDDTVTLTGTLALFDRYENPEHLAAALTVNLHTHIWQTGATLTEPTCIQAGMAERTCSACGEKGLVTLPALGHAFAAEFTVDKEPTATQAGRKSRHCTRCDAVIDVTEIPATATPETPEPTQTPADPEPTQTPAAPETTAAPAAPAAAPANSSAAQTGADGYIVCEACGYHDWEAYLDGWRCTNCGHLRGTSGEAADPTAKTAAPVPATGDHDLPGLWLTLLLASAGGMYVLLRRRKTETHKENGV